MLDRTGFGGLCRYDPSAMTAEANDTLIAEAGRRLAAAAPGPKVILFGSRARGEALRTSKRSAPLVSRTSFTISSQ